MKTLLPYAVKTCLFLLPGTLYLLSNTAHISRESFVFRNNSDTQISRLQRVHEICKTMKFKGTLRERQLSVMSHLMVDFTNGLTYCWNHKAASTFWSEFFARSTNNSYILRSGEYYKLKDYLAPRTEKDLIQSLEDNFKFLVIRHPLSRIVSAYRDRILSHPESFQAKKYIPLIRESLFSELRNNESMPSFKDFAKFLAARDGIPFDSHWNPYYLQCDPCSIKYDAVIKVESMNSDFKILVNEGQIPKISFSLSRRHSSNLSLKDDSLLTKKYLSELDPPVLKKLLSIYEQDFRLFEYDPRFYS